MSTFHISHFSFARSIAGSDVEEQDLSLDEPYHILFGRQPSSSSRQGSLSIHPMGAGNPSVSSEQINPATDNADVGTDQIRNRLTRAHGILMIIAWPIMAVTAIFFAAWMRPALPNGEWFQMHRAFMLGSLFVGALGFILIFAAQYRTNGLINFSGNVRAVLDTGFGCDGNY